MAETVVVKDPETLEETPFYYLSPLIWVAMQGLTPILSNLRERPLDRNTWRKNSIHNTRWAKKWHHLTSRGDWALIWDGSNTHFISSGSLIQQNGEIFVVHKLAQRPCREIVGLNFSRLGEFDANEAKGRQSVSIQQVDMTNGEIHAITGELEWRHLITDEDWEYVGQVEDFVVADHLDLPATAGGLCEGVQPGDDMWIWGVNIDGTGMFTFSQRLAGTEMLYLRDWGSRLPYYDMAWTCGACIKGGDPRLMIGMLGRDVALTEQKNIRTLKVLDNGDVVWRRIHMHLGNVVGDRRGTDGPLNKLNSGDQTRFEWKDFASWDDGFGMGIRNDGPHAFGGDARMFRSVCCP